VRAAFVELRGRECSRSWHIVAVDEEHWPRFKRVARRWGSVPYRLAERCGILLKWSNVSRAPLWACADGPMLFESVQELAEWVEECLWRIYRPTNWWHIAPTVHTLDKELSKLIYVYGEPPFPGAEYDPVLKEYYDGRWRYDWCRQALARGQLLARGAQESRLVEVYELRGSHAILLREGGDSSWGTAYFILKAAAPADIARQIGRRDLSLNSFLDAVSSGARALRGAGRPDLAERLERLAAAVAILA
jgi:hypothetical protein